MILLNAFKLALRALKRNTLRSLLTMLGIIIGVGAVIAVVSIGNGARVQIESNIAGLGQNVVQVMSGAVRRGGVSQGFGSAGTLTKEDYDALRSEVSGVVGISPEVRSQSQVAVGNQNSRVQIMGVGPDYASIRSWNFASGDNFTDYDVDRANKVAVIGKTTADSLFGEGTDPVGQIVRIGNAPFTIVGYLTPKGMNMFGSDQDDIILVPYTSAMKRLSGGTAFRSIVMEAAGPSYSKSIQTQITDFLRQRHRTTEETDDFNVRTQQELTEVFTAQSKTMTMLLGSVAGVSLFVGGIGIMNIMLVSVTERTREIGVRLAVGARGRDILMQFLIEAVTLSIVGGIIGIFAGGIVSNRLAALMGSPTLIDPQSVLLAFCSSAVIGICFGFFPAFKASQLDPIDALRYE
jgi:putative ABC transport system permease protein